MKVTYKAHGLSSGYDITRKIKMSIHENDVVFSTMQFGDVYTLSPRYCEYKYRSVKRKRRSYESAPLSMRSDDYTPISCIPNHDY